jgi:hypothetical protein
MSKLILIYILTYVKTHTTRSKRKKNSEQALQIIGDVVAELYANKRSMHGCRQSDVSNATLLHCAAKLSHKVKMNRSFLYFTSSAISLC